MKQGQWIILLLIAICLSACTAMKSNDEQQAKNTKVAMINIRLGMAYLEKQNIDRAKQKLLYALEKDPSLPEAWYSMGYFLENTGNKQEANQYYIKAMKLAPGRGDVQNNYGTYLCRMGDYRGAIQHFKLATQDPSYLDSASAYENAGICALKIPNRQLALAYFKQAVATDPNRILSQLEVDKLNKRKV